MYIKVFLFLFVTFVSFNAISINLKFNSRLLKYDLQLEKKMVSIKGSRVNILLKSRKCNKKILTDLFNEIRSKINDRVHQKHTSKRSYEYSLDNRQYFISRNDDFAGFLLTIPHIIKKVSINEKINCKSK